MPLKIIAALIWLYEVIYGIVKCARGEPVHPLVFTIAAATILLLCIIEIIEEAC